MPVKVPDAAVTVPTVILGVPDKPVAVVAVPVKAPTNVEAVATPTVILGVPDKPVAVVAVPVKAPTNVVAVTTSALIVTLVPTSSPFLTLKF